MSKFRTVAIFAYPAEAVVVKGKLESENVQVYLKDEFSVAADPFATNAIGGVKMQVYKEDFIKAMGIIEQFNPDLLKHRVEYVKCPNCGKCEAREIANIETARTFAEKMKAVGLSVLPFSTAFNYQCKNCQTKFDVDE
jgi:DNA-directed RNA polymerase subunit RPC12/RpoP